MACIGSDRGVGARPKGGTAKAVFIFAGLLVLLGVAVGLRSSANPAAADSLAPYAALVAELDLRRRVNVLHPNPQSIFDGLHVGHVNIAAGNLTFRRRDIVAPAGPGGAVVFARVYDSRIETNADLGPGWRLSLAEELRLDGDRATYIDRAGAAYEFRRKADGYHPHPPTPRHAGTTLAVTSNKAVLRERDGTKRVFLRADAEAPFLLRRVVSAAGHKVLFAHEDGLLNTVSHDGATVFTITRLRNGRVSEVADHHGRSVRYSYTAAGRLKDVYDIGGNLWWHEYGEAGLLTEAIGPNQRAYLRARYDKAGRVTATRTGRGYEYAYGRSRTVVTDGVGLRHVFEQNRLGATERYTANNGAWWKIGFDASGRVNELDTAGRTLRYAYDALGAVTETREVTDRGATVRDRRFVHDGEGRLTSIETDSGDRLAIDYYGEHAYLSGLGVDFDFRLSAGLVESAWDGRRLVDAERDGEGNVTALRSGGATVFFARDALGRIVRTTYPDGFSGRYFHDALGNRRLAQYDDGASVRYGHDAAGNIVRVVVTEADGSTKAQTTVVGDMNRVERIVYEGSAAIDVLYDGAGRPTRFETGEDTVSASYDGIGRLAQLESEKTGAVWRPPADQQGGSPAADPRRAVLAGDALGRAQPDYGVVDFDEATFAASPRDPVALAVPGLAEARALVAAAAPLFEPGAAAFEKPSNPVFQAREYRATNCCVPCPADLCWDCYVPVFGTFDVCYCNPPFYPWPWAWTSVSSPAVLERIISEYDGLKRVPSRTEFVKEHSSEHFSTRELNDGHYDYFIPGRMTEIAEAVRKAYNDAIDSDTDYGIRITSGYRNPRRNREIGGKTNSKHQWGNAVDLAPPRNPNARPPGKSYEDAMTDIEKAAKILATYGVKNEGDHVHVQIR